jgi:ech hydrogenase subunit C
MKGLMTSQDGTVQTMPHPTSSMSARLANWARLKSPWVTVFNTGGCNACDIEVIACLMPRFDVERFGILAKSSPRHADILIVTGPVTRKQSTRLRRIWEQMPEPKYVIGMGACCASGGVFHGLYHTMDGVESTIPVDIWVAGCPPRPDEIIDAVVKCLGLMKEDLARGGRAWRQVTIPKAPDSTGEAGEIAEAGDITETGEVLA